MKYRIKDPRKRTLIKELFDIEVFNSGHTDTELRVDLCFDGINFASNYLPVEKVQELAEDWNPFPETKPQKEGRYLVALKCNDDGERNIVDAANFAENCFDAWHSESGIIAWKEMPKIWKGD